MNLKNSFNVINGGNGIMFQRPLADVVYFYALYSIGCSFLIAAFMNLLFFRPLPLSAIFASLAWIVIMLIPFVRGCGRFGVRQHFGNVLGHLIRNRFCQHVIDESGSHILCFGYKFLNYLHYFMKVKASGVKSVNWEAGQGNIPENENCWNIIMNFDPSAIVLNGVHDLGRCWHFGPSGQSKSHQESHGKQFIDFLRSNGVHLALPPFELIGQEATVVAESPYSCVERVRVGENEYSACGRRIDKGCTVVIEEIRGTSVYVREKKVASSYLEAADAQLPGTSSPRS